MNQKSVIPENVRRVLASILQWGGWLGCLALFFWATNTYNPNKGHFAPQWVGFAFIFSLGVAIAGTTARSRMRITDTIVSAFKVGMSTAEEQRAAMVEQLQHIGDEAHK